MCTSDVILMGFIEVSLLLRAGVSRGWRAIGGGAVDRAILAASCVALPGRDQSWAHPKSRHPLQLQVNSAVQTVHACGCAVWSEWPICCHAYLKEYFLCAIESFLCPCRVKFGAFYEHLASNFSQAFDRIGSGHYARLVRDPGGDCGSQVRLAMTPDAVKDQTYFLAHLSQQQLARTIFPLGTLTKVRWKSAADRRTAQRMRRAVECAQATHRSRSSCMQKGISMRKACQLMRWKYAAPTVRRHVHYRPRDGVQAPYFIRHNAVKDSRGYGK